MGWALACMDESISEKNTDPFLGRATWPNYLWISPAFHSYRTMG